MAARFRPKTYTFTSSPVSVYSALGSPVNDKWGQSITLRAEYTNVGTAYWQDSTGEKGGYLRAGEAASIDIGGMWLSTSDIYISGTENDKVYITVLG